MSANPPMTRTYDGSLAPTPYQGEAIVLRRDCIDIKLSDLRTASGKRSTRGSIYLTNMRLVFIAQQPDASSGLHAFELPLAYLRGDKFNQPIFGCNNLSGECWPAVAGGGPAGGMPPHKFALYFKEGGVGTFLPLYFRFVEYWRHVQRRPQEAAQEAAAAPQGAYVPPAASMANTQHTMATAFVDPSDPSKVFLTSPVDEAHRAPSAPVYAPNYAATQHERYEPMEPPRPPPAV